MNLYRIIRRLRTAGSEKDMRSRRIREASSEDSGRTEACGRQSLRHNLISMIASDAHSPLQRTPYMLDAYEELSREYSENHLDVLFQYNPARICDNREILRLEPVPYSGQ